MVIKKVRHTNKHINLSLHPMVSKAVQEDAHLNNRPKQLKKVKISKTSFTMLNLTVKLIVVSDFEGFTNAHISSYHLQYLFTQTEASN